jgi:hypothetical protein
MSEILELSTERLEAFEERLGVKIEGLFVSIGGDKYITINGELHSNDGTQLGEDIKLMISAHDSSGRVVGAGYSSIRAKSFFGFEAFSERFKVHSESVSRVRIYPRQSN